MVHTASTVPLVLHQCLWAVPSPCACSTRQGSAPQPHRLSIRWFHSSCPASAVRGTLEAGGKTVMPVEEREYQHSQLRRDHSKSAATPSSQHMDLVPTQNKPWVYIPDSNTHLVKHYKLCITAAAAALLQTLSLPPRSAANLKSLQLSSPCRFME